MHINKVDEIKKILEKHPEFIRFQEDNPQFDFIIRELSNTDIVQIREEFSEMGLFSDPGLQEVLGVTVVSRVIEQQGYPKIKAYIDKKKEKIVHLFRSG